MAGKRTVIRECQRLNQARNVREVRSYSIDHYWKHADGGNYLIAGGTEHSRTNMLSAKLLLDAKEIAGPSFVLTTSDLLEQELIRRFSKSEFGRLYVSSRNYRNYHFFYGWNSIEIVWFLIRAAELLGFTNADLPNYMRAFIDVICQRYQPSLGSILELAKYSDAQIAQIAEAYGVSHCAGQLILRYAGAGETFRLVLEQVRNVFLPITTAQCNTRYNLSSSTAGPCDIRLVNVRSNHPELMHEYFSIELRRANLRYAANRGMRPLLVLSDLQLRARDPLVATVLESQNAGLMVGVCLENPVMLQQNTERDLRLNSRVILLDGGFADADLENLLAPLGTYTHYEPLTDGGVPPRLFNLLTDEHWRATPEPRRLRVRPADTAGYYAVLYGGNGREILLTRALY